MIQENDTMQWENDAGNAALDQARQAAFSWTGRRLLIQYTFGNLGNKKNILNIR
jgi:hypothetical protein